MNFDLDTDQRDAAAGARQFFTGSASCSWAWAGIHNAGASAAPTRRTEGLRRGMDRIMPDYSCAVKPLL